MAILETINYPIYINHEAALLQCIQRYAYSKIAILVDENTKKYCLPLIPIEIQERAVLIEIKSGEHHKNISTCQHIWSEIIAHGFDRSSLLINLGGGVIGDMGGFCAASYMRGIDFIQIPTTLLSQVDASVGGKLGIDFQGLKNMVGLFAHPKAVLVNTDFLTTLDQKQKRSGFAEMIKHGLIYDKALYESYTNLEADIHEANITQNIAIKAAIVKEDFKETGLRKILNFGHTIGHAVESTSLSTSNPLLHGEAIAIGMIAEAYLSYKKTGLSESKLTQISQYILSIYDHQPQYVSDRDSILENILHDKKNQAGDIRASLLTAIGACVENISCSIAEVQESLDYYAALSR